MESDLAYLVKCSNATRAKVKRDHNSTFYLTDLLVTGQAPEMFEGHSLSEKIDVYSFGILLWECFTGEVPWSELDSPMQVNILLCHYDHQNAVASDTFQCALSLALSA